MLKFLCSVRRGLFYLMHFTRLSDENCSRYVRMYVNISYLCLANKYRVLKLLDWCAAQTSKLNNSASVIVRKPKFLCSVRRGLFYLLHFPRLSDENCSRHLRMYVNISYLCLANKHRVLKLWDWNAAPTSKLKSSASVIVRMLKLLCSLRGGLFYLIHIPRLSDENCFLYLWMNVIISYCWELWFLSQGEKHTTTPLPGPLSIRRGSRGWGKSSASHFFSPTGENKLHYVGK